MKIKSDNTEHRVQIITPKRILAEEIANHSISEDELLGNSKSPNVVKARAIAYQRLRKLGLSKSECGKYLKKSRGSLVGYEKHL